MEILNDCSTCGISNYFVDNYYWTIMETMFISLALII